mmetsp:Transcript_4501/g.6796  ORF Transcript_4501/g.6796 Transcript_4501/m.6796 type:complete len:349 (+) Transcript_4501:2-1048(+)
MKGLQLKVNLQTSDSPGLFNYESTSSKKTLFELKKSGKVKFEEDSFQLVPIYETHRNSFVSFFRKNNYYLVRPAPGHKLWKVVKYFQNFDESKAHLLKKGDLVKLGSVPFKVRSTASARVEELPVTDSATCRICLSSKSSEQNPLVSPCKCSGSLKHIHLECLQLWVNTKLTLKKYPKFRVYYWEKLYCELCMQSLPTKIVCKHQKFDLLKVDSTEKPCLVLEELSKETTGSRKFYVIEGNPLNSVKFGRGHSADIVVNDTSVSRIHSVIYYRNSGFYIKDHNSKFGTLLKADKEVRVGVNETLTFQVGKTLMTLKLKESFSLMRSLFRSCCGKAPKKALYRKMSLVH